jgi:predicted HTH domain antitoxin
MSLRTDVATLHRIAIEAQRLRTLAIKDGLESVARLLEAALNEARAELAHRGEPPDPPIPSNDPKITRLSTR